MNVTDIDEVVDTDRLTIMLQLLPEPKLYSSSAEEQNNELGSDTKKFDL